MKKSLKTMSPTYQNKYNFVKTIIAKINTNKKNVLDIGCGYGEYLQLYKENSLKVEGIDIDRTAIKYCENGRYGSITSIPFEENTFDIVNCIDVLEHIKNDKLAMSEIARVLKKEGIFIMTVFSEQYPFTYDPINRICMLFNKHIPIGAWHWGHERLYSKKHIFSLLNMSGFKVIKYEQRTHWFVTLFINYIPTIVDKFFVKGNYGNKKENGFFLQWISFVFKILNNIDKTVLRKFNGVNHCIVAINTKSAIQR